MNINEVAKRLLDLREKRMTGFIMSGVLREELGFEGYGEALRRRWIEADLEQSGMVTVTNNLAKVEEIRTLAAECKDRCGSCGKNKCSCEGRCDACKGEKCACESKQESLTETAHFFAQAHAFRRNASLSVGESMCSWCHKKPAFSPSKYCQDCEARHQADLDSAPEGERYGIYQDKDSRKPRGESATLGLGRTGDAPNVPVPGLGAQSAGQSAPKAPSSVPPPTTARQNVIGIGSDVAVVEGGKQYVGKVSRTLPDGRYEVSFAGEQPPVRRPYDKTEVSTAASQAAAR